jgi:ribose transport system substrate-binding protein
MMLRIRPARARRPRQRQRVGNNRPELGSWEVKMKSKLAISIAFTFATLVAGFVAEAQAAEGKVAYFATGPTNRFVAALSKGFMEHAKELGLEATIFENSYDPAVQVQQIDDAIARKFDMLAIQPASEKAVIPALVRAKEAGIPVIIMVNDAAEGTEDLYLSYVGEDNYTLGKLAGESVLKALKDAGREEAKVALITGSLANPKAEIVATEDAYWDTAKSEQIAGQLFARYAAQGGLDVIYGMADNQAVAVTRAAEAAGIPLGTEAGKLIVVGSNCDTDGLQAIVDGKQYSTATQAPLAAGRRAAELVADHLSGKSVPKIENLPAEAVTAENIETWRDACTY